MSDQMLLRLHRCVLSFYRRFEFTVATMFVMAASMLNWRVAGFTFSGNLDRSGYSNMFVEKSERK